MAFEVDNNYEWATHQPLIKAVLKVFNPNFILELGAGYHSTLIFKDHPAEFMSIDDNKEWVDYLNITYGTKILWHNTGFENNNIHYKDLTPYQKSSLAYSYCSLALPGTYKSLLFVDHFTCGRFIAINELKDRFDFIIFHDCQPEGQREFSYDLLNYEGFKTYYLKSQTSWTCLMVNEMLDKGIDPLLEAIQPFLFEFKMKYPEIPYMELTDKF
jgi:hypothetical protein